MKIEVEYSITKNHNITSEYEEYWEYVYLYIPTKSQILKRNIVKVVTLCVDPKLTHSQNQPRSRAGFLIKEDIERSGGNMVEYIKKIIKDNIDFYNKESSIFKGDMCDNRFTIDISEKDIKTLLNINERRLL